MANGNMLVVEDDDQIRRLLVDYLEQKAAVRVDSARDGIEALHLMIRKSYALVVLDLMMPKMSGVDFLVSMVALASDPSVKALSELPSVVVVTAAGEEDVPAALLCERFGHVRAVLRKPLEVERLAEVIDRLAGAPGTGYLAES